MNRASAGTAADKGSSERASDHYQSNKGRDSFEFRNKKPEKPQSDFYDPFAMRFVWMKPIQRTAFPSQLRSMSNNMISDFLKPTTESTVKFRILFKLFLKIEREVVEMWIMHRCFVFLWLDLAQSSWSLPLQHLFQFFRRKLQLKLNKKWIEMVVRMGFFSSTRRLNNKTKLRAKAWLKLATRSWSFYVLCWFCLCIRFRSTGKQHFSKYFCRFKFLSFHSVASCIWVKRRVDFLWIIEARN